MEVVSPLSFNQGGKRRFGSPIHGVSVATSNATAGEDFDMDDCSGYGFQATKRRKRSSNEGGCGGSIQSKENWSLLPFVQAPSRSPHSTAGRHTQLAFPVCPPSMMLTLFLYCLSPTALSSVWGSRVLAQHDDATAQKMQELQVMVEQQAAEIQRLKTEKESVEASTSQLSSHQAKVEHENKILKRAVTIQQERQNQMTAELEGARQFKAAAEERVRRLEQMNLTLQYRLQATMASENDFSWSSPRPPDVY